MALSFEFVRMGVGTRGGKGSHQKTVMRTDRRSFLFRLAVLQCNKTYPRLCRGKRE
jgi:hypothetical protein